MLVSYPVISKGNMKVSVTFTWAILVIEQTRMSSQCPAQHNVTCSMVVRVKRPVNRALTDSAALGRAGRVSWTVQPQERLALAGSQATKLSCHLST